MNLVSNLNQFWTDRVCLTVALCYKYVTCNYCTLILLNFSFFLDVEITCPNHTNVYINRSDVAFKNVSWNKPLVHNKKNGTKFFVEVFPQWAKPPVTLPARSAVYVIKYMVTHEFGQTASCSFNITVYNGSCKLNFSLLLAIKFGCFINVNYC